jgi:type VI secretion system secreted protein VgrG
MALKETAHEAKFLFTIAGTSHDTAVMDFRAQERLSAPYDVSLTLACEDEINFDDVVGKEAVLTIVGDGQDRHVHGIVNEFMQTGSKGRFFVYETRVVPALWLLSLEQDCRIFQNKTVQDIITQVLKDGGITTDRFAFRLQGQYQPRDYCVQYRETDLNFISRLLEEEGIFYFFEHEKDKHSVVFADSTVVYKPIAGDPNVTFNPSEGAVPEAECILGFAFSRRVFPGKVTRRDYNFEKPALDLTTQDQAKEYQTMELYDYPGEYPDTQRGKKLAQIRLQESMTYQTAAEGNSTCPRLVPGSTFTLKDHDRKDFNQDYLLVEVTNTGTQPQALEEQAAGGSAMGYSNRFLAIPSAVTFRPRRTAIRPVVEGVQTAIVVGPAGEEIYTDEHGRVKVQFHWDREGKKDEKSSCWVRVSQLWAGEGWGAMHIPRIGQEVIVDFIEGDPDRPLVTGRVYHGTNKPPYPLPDEKTKSTIISNTSLGGKTHNELLMEDKQGKTQVVLSNAYGHKITEDEDTQTLTVETRDKHTIRLDDKNKNITVQTTKAHKILMDDDNKKIAVTTTDGYALEMDDQNEKMLAHTKNGHTIVMDDKNKKVELTTVDGHSAVFDDGNQKIGITSKKGHFMTIDDSGDSITLEDSSGMHRFKLDIGGSKLVISSDTGSIELEAPSGKISLKATQIDIDAQMELKMKGGMNVTSEAGVQHTTKGTMVTTQSSGPNTIKGTPVMIN